MTRTPVPLLAAALIATVLAAIPRPAVAVWPGNPLVNVPLCTATGNQSLPKIVSDGAGGAIVTWYDYRSGTNYDIYAQRISAAGEALWTANGVALCTAAGDQQYPTIVSDGAGGAIVTWDDSRSGTNDIYTQRISATGAVQWTPNGVPLCTATGQQYTPTIVSDGAGGAIVTWLDSRSGASDIYAQRISATGTVQWLTNGVVLCIATGNQQVPTIVSDGAGGAIVTWSDYRSGTNYDIYAQRISSTGTVQWTADGVALCTDTSAQYTPTIVSDGVGGAIVIWQDQRNGNNDIYAQRISAAGAVQWTANGVALCTATSEQQYPTIVSDGAGGAIVTWWDYRSGGGDIYAQRISSTSTVQWTANGVALCTATGDQRYPTIVSDGAGGAIVTWDDSRSGTNNDIYAQRIERFGYLGPEPAIASVRDVPGDQGGKVKLSWDASYYDTMSDPNFTAYDILRSVPPNQALTALAKGGRAFASLAELDKTGAPSYLVTQAGATTYYWEYLTSVSALRYVSGYSYLAPTVCDSMETGNPATAFMVVARNASSSMYWLSAPDSGYSVDNLAPLTPAPFTGQYANGTATMSWAANTAADFAEYRLYRGSTAGFVPGPANLVAAQPNTGYVDAAGAPYYYKLCAVDIHGNVSGFSTLLPSGTVDVAGPALPRVVFLAPPAPNPARGATTLRFDLPREARVELALYDQQGRRVRSLISGTQPAGERTIVWDGSGDSGRALPAGLYFVRLATEGRTFVSRLAVIR